MARGRKFNVSIFLLVVPLVSLALNFLYLLTLPYKLFVLMLAKLFRPELRGLIREGQFPLNTLRARVEKRVAEAKNRNGTYRFQRLREFATIFMGFDFWRNYVNFHVSKHVHALDPSLIKGFNKSSLFEQKLERLTSAVVAESSWAENQSQWEILLVSFPHENRTVLATRFHHKVADGYSHMFIAESLFQQAFEHQPKTAPATKIWDSFNLKHLALYPVRMVRDTAEVLHMLAHDQNTSWHCKDFQNVDCISAYSVPIRVQDIKRIRKELGMGYDTVIYHALGRALSRVMQDAHQQLHPYVSLLFLGPKVNHPGTATNHFHCHFMPLSSEGSSTLQNLNQKVLSAKRSLCPVWANLFIGEILHSLPIPLKKVQSLLTADPTILISSFVPCDARAFDGCKILDVIGFLGCRLSRTGAYIYVAGAADTVRISVVLSKSVAPDVDSARRLVDFAWEEVQRMRDSERN